MERFPQVNQSPDKTSFIDPIDVDDGDNGVLGGTFRVPDSKFALAHILLEDRPRGRQRKLPLRPKIETSEVKESGESKEETKPPANSGPKVFIEATKSRWRPGEMEAMNNDPSSYTQNLVTPEMQAVKEPDFIGDALYYNLANSMVLQQLEGEYVILYTRPVGEIFDKQFKSATIIPSMTNKISIFTRRAQGQGEIGQIMQEVLAAGAWAAGHIEFQGMGATIGCEHIPDDTSRSNRNTAHALMGLGSVDPVEYKKNPLFNLALRDTGSTISFGLKSMERQWDETEKRVIHYGFYFLKLEICHHDDKLKNTGRQLIVAVKIPKAGDGDVSSLFILKQNRFTPRDLAILESDIRVRELADWRTYAVTQRYHDLSPVREWNPQTPKRLGLSTTGFKADQLEKYLSTIANPIQELGNIADWIVEFTAVRPTSKIGRIFKEAYDYIDNRRLTMRGELNLREAVGAEKLALSMRRGAQTEDAHALQGGRDIESGRSERRGIFGGRINRGFEVGDESEPALHRRSEGVRQDDNEDQVGWF